MRALLNVVLAVAAAAAAVYLARHPLDPPAETWLLVIGPIATVLIALAGRWSLARWPTREGAAHVTGPVHFTFALVIGAPLVAAAVWAVDGRGPGLPLPTSVCAVVAAILGVPGLVLFLASIVNLALNGLGAPFAVALTRRLASDWLYSRTRNPMMLGVFLLAIGMAFAWRSGLFVVWTIAGFIPAILAFLKLYEEPELALRFGNDYTAYRARTPFLFPRL